MVESQSHGQSSRDQKGARIGQRPDHRRPLMVRQVCTFLNGQRESSEDFIHRNEILYNDVNYILERPI